MHQCCGLQISKTDRPNFKNFPLGQIAVTANRIDFELKAAVGYTDLKSFSTSKWTLATSKCCSIIDGFDHFINNYGAN